MGTRRTWLAMIVVAVIVLGACGSGGSTGSEESLASTPIASSADGAGADTTENTSDKIDEQSVVAAAALESAYGATDGVAAFLWAQDRGYDVETLLAAAIDGRLTAGGEVTLDEVVVAPEGPQLGVFILPDEPEGLRQPQGLVTRKRASAAPVDSLPPYNMPRVVQALQEQIEGLDESWLRDVVSTPPGADATAKTMLITIILLARVGYTPDQVIEAFVLETSALTIYKGCPLLVSEAISEATIPNVIRPRVDFDTLCGKDAREANQQYSEYVAGLEVGLESEASDAPSSTRPGSDASDGSAPSGAADASDGGESAEFVDGIYAGQFTYDYALFRDIAPENQHDSRDIVEQNAVTVIISDGQVDALSGQVNTFFAAPEPGALGALGCETRTTFELTGDSAGQVESDGIIEFEVFITGARTSNCEGLPWELSDTSVLAQLVQDDGSIGLVLSPFDSPYVLTANLPAG